MTRLSIAGVTILGTLAVALVLGTQWLQGDPNSTTIVTVLGMLGLGISQMLSGKEVVDTKAKTEELSKNLHNGTFERILREALVKLAEEKGFPLEIQNGKEDDNG